MDYISEGARKRQKLILARKVVLCSEKAGGGGPERDMAARCLRCSLDRLSCQPEAEDPVALASPSHSKIRPCVVTSRSRLLRAGGSTLQPAVRPPPFLGDGEGNYASCVSVTCTLIFPAFLSNKRTRTSLKEGVKAESGRLEATKIGELGRGREAAVKRSPSLQC